MLRVQLTFSCMGLIIIYSEIVTEQICSRDFKKNRLLLQGKFSRRVVKINKKIIITHTKVCLFPWHRDDIQTMK